MTEPATISAENPAMQASISLARRAPRHRNLRLFSMGQGISVIGTWMARLATAWQKKCEENAQLAAREFELIAEELEPAI